MSTKSISFRIKPEEIAKALEGLIANNINPAELTTISNVVRTTFYYGIIHLCEDPNSPAGKEFKKMVNQLFNQNKTGRNVRIKDLLNGE